MLTKKEKEERVILAHSIAKKVASVEHISYRGAIEILDHAKNILENNMKAQRAAVPMEIRDEWGTIIKEIGDKTPSEERKNVINSISGVLQKKLKYAEERATEYNIKRDTIKANIWDNRATVYKDAIETVIFCNLKNNSTKAGGNK